MVQLEVFHVTLINNLLSIVTLNTVKLCILPKELINIRDNSRLTDTIVACERFSNTTNLRCGRFSLSLPSYVEHDFVKCRSTENNRCKLYESISSNYEVIS